MKTSQMTNLVNQLTSFFFNNLAEAVYLEKPINNDLVWYIAQKQS